MPGGRPTEYKPEIVDEILERVSNGESLKTICETPGMPKKTAVFRWQQQNEEFRELLARAREAFADSVFDEVIDLADDSSNDHQEITDKDGNPIGRFRVNGDAIARSRLRVETRLKMAAILKPRVYSERIQHDHTHEITLLSNAELYGQLVESYQVLGLPAPSKEALGLVDE